MRRFWALILLLTAVLSCTMAQAKAGLSPAMNASTITSERFIQNELKGSILKFCPISSISTPSVTLEKLSVSASPQIIFLGNGEDSLTGERESQCIMESLKNSRPLSAVIFKTTGTRVLEHLRVCGTRSVEFSEKVIVAAAVSPLSDIKPDTSSITSRQVTISQNLVERK